MILDEDVYVIAGRVVRIKGIGIVYEDGQFVPERDLQFYSFGSPLNPSPSLNLKEK